MHHLYGYRNLRAANVLSTIELLRFASLQQAKKIHFISTLAAVIDQENGKFLEDFPKQEPDGTESGYVLSKRGSEKILADAADRGFSITVYRPPQIVGHSKTGYFPADSSHFMMLLKGCIQMEHAPNDLQTWPLMAVDDVAKIIVQGIKQPELSKGKVFNLTPSSPPGFSDIFSWLNQEGYFVRMIPAENWKNSFMSKIDERNALYPLSSLYLNSESKLAANREQNNVEYETANLENILKDSHMKLVEINKESFSLYIRYVSREFLKDLKNKTWGDGLY